jgi:hypothetical protein
MEINGNNMTTKINLNTNPITFNSKAFQETFNFKELSKELVAMVIHPLLSDYTIATDKATKKLILALESEFKSEVDITTNKEEQLLDLVRAYRKGINLETITEKIIEIVSNPPWDSNNSGMF